MYSEQEIDAKIHWGWELGERKREIGMGRERGWGRFGREQERERDGKRGRQRWKEREGGGGLGERKRETEI